MSNTAEANAKATQDLMTRLDDLVRDFLAERPGAAVGLELTLLQPRDARRVDSCHGWGEWEPGDPPGAGWVKGISRAPVEPPPTWAERRAALRRGVGSS